MSAEATPRLALPYLAAGQAQKHVTHNDALIMLDALVQLAVRDRDRPAPPEAPTEGDRHIVTPAASGPWSGQAGKVALFQDGAWSFHAPHAGWLAWVVAEQALCVFDGAGWRRCETGLASLNPVAMVGINTTADATRPLSVKGEGVLFSHRDAPAGSGDIRLAFNKAAASNTASLLFQTGWSGRIEIGSAGSDDFHLKTSADGAVWREALYVRASDGAVGINHAAPAHQLDVGGSFGAGPASFAGNVLPAADNAHALGSASARWSAIYAANGTISTSDARLKQDIVDCPLGLDFIRRLSPKLYRWRDPGTEEAGRLHAGLIAQEVKAALDACGVDCGLWLAEEGDDPLGRQSLRYEQLLAPLVQAVKQLAARLDALEGR